MQTGKVAIEHYAYVKHGLYAPLAAIEPLTGKRQATVYKRRTKKEYAMFLQAVSASCREAVKIRLMQDNLNTHNVISFYKRFPEQEAFALSHHFEFYYTPKSPSWLNMIEIGFSALTKQCLDRRIPSQEELNEEIGAIIKERNEKWIKINWQFLLGSQKQTQFLLSLHHSCK